MKRRKEKISINSALNLVRRKPMTLLMAFISIFTGCSYPSGRPMFPVTAQTEDVDTLIQRLKAEESLARARAAYALGMIHDPRAVEPLIAALKDESFSVRASAAYALGMIHDPRAVEPLITALRDEGFSVRRDAAEALGNIKDPRAVEPLIAALKDDFWSVRHMAAEALGKIEDPRGVEAVIAAELKDKSVKAAAAAYDSFIRRGEPGAEAILIEALNKYGDKKMAEAFLNCGNAQLETAGRDWARSRGYIIMASFRVGNPRWGGGS